MDFIQGILGGLCAGIFLGVLGNSIWKERTIRDLREIIALMEIRIKGKEN